MVAKEPGSRISIPFNVTVPALLEDPLGRTASESNSHMTGQGYVKLGHLRSNVLGLGSLECWVDRAAGTDGASSENNRSTGTLKHPTRVDGWWDIRERNQGV